MPHLVLHCRFVAHSYSGVRLTEDRREELDWPPSPGRLHQALMAAALGGVPPCTAESEAALAALRWLEKQLPPEILASEITEGGRTRPRVAIPQNNPKGADLGGNSILLAPTLRATPANEQDLEVVYRWQLNEGSQNNPHLRVLENAALQLSYLGRAEDRVEVSAQIVDELSPSPLIRWWPASAAAHRLWLAQDGTTDALERRFRTPVAPRERKSPAQRWMIAQPYSPVCLHPRPPVYVAIFQILPMSDDPDASPLSCDPELSGRWRAAVRGRVVELAREVDWDNRALANELLTGHSGDNGQRAEQPHLAIVPLPSFNSSGTADGRVRRIALLGFAHPGVADGAREIYEGLGALLDGDCVPELSGRLRMCGDIGRDKVWCQLIGISRVWHSLTPVAIARGFKVPRFTPDGRLLSTNERHRRKLAELSALLRSSMRHIDLPESLVNECNIELTPSPLLRRSERAERYRPPGETAVLTHARIEFPEPVQGPLLIGDRRYQGLGLFVPMNERDLAEGGGKAG